MMFVNSLTKVHLFFIFIFGWSICLVQSKLESIPLPKTLENCLRDKNINRPTLTDEEEIGSCMMDFLWNNNQKCGAVSEDTVRWFSRLAVNRTRQIRWRHIPPRERKEYRMLSDQEREDYHRAVKMLKQNKNEHPNKYDAFVEFHRGIAGTAAHRGPAFLGWHRYYLFLYEQALQEEVPGVMLPYWDSTLDWEMDDATDSVIWTNVFAGNGNGTVKTGPFSNWIIPTGQPLIRAFGQGQLMGKDRVLESLVNHGSHETFGQDLEMQHDNVHLWVGGHMADIELAPSDPMFFMHHAFVDCVWEKFRERFILQNMDPADDYPNVIGSHASTAYMANLPPFPDPKVGNLEGKNLTNKDGYRNFWTQEYYRCAPLPECSYKRPDCGSKWLECNIFTQRCVSKGSEAALPKVTPEQMMKVMYTCYPDRLPANVKLEAHPEYPKLSYEMISSGEMFYTYFQKSFSKTTHSVGKRDTHHFSNSFRHIQTQFKRVTDPPQEQTTTSYYYDYYEPVEHVQQKTSPVTWTIDEFYLPKIDKPCDGYPIQNTFLLNCEAGINLWAFVPVKVVHIRHGDVKYATYQDVNLDGTVSEKDIYEQGQWIEFFNGRPLKKRPTINKCHDDKSGIVKIRIKSMGLNYEGTYSDNVFVDNRQPATEAISFIAVKNPKYGTAKVLFTAVDQCGISCRAYCITKNHPHKEPDCEECSGAVKLNSGSPNMYYDSYMKAASSVWQKSRSDIIFSDDNQIPIIFYCDYKETRPPKLFTSY